MIRVNGSAEAGSRGGPSTASLVSMISVAAGRGTALARFIGVVALISACRNPAPTIEPTPRPVSAAHDSAMAGARTGASDSPDVAFVRAMIPHHRQALEMTALAPTRTTRDDVRRIAERIARAQGDEIAAMERWLRRRGLAAAGGAHAHHGAAHAMPGMLTREELTQLERAAGPVFDRLFLEKMIRHHEGALIMVKQLFANPGAARDSELYQIAADVDADQRAEIARLQSLLSSLP